MGQAVKEIPKPNNGTTASVAGYSFEERFIFTLTAAVKWYRSTIKSFPRLPKPLTRDTKDIKNYDQ